MKTFLLILGIAMMVVGLQDAVRALIDNDSINLFSWVPGGFTVHIAINVALAIGGLLLASYASKMKPKQ